MTADVGAESLEVVVGEVGNESGEPVGVEQFLADGGTVGGHDSLLVAVHQTVEAGGQQAACPSEEVVPRTAPEHLDDVPAGTSEAAFQFLDDLGVATDGTVEALQVAVHRHHDVVKALTTGEESCESDSGSSDSPSPIVYQHGKPPSLQDHGPQGSD